MPDNEKKPKQLFWQGVHPILKPEHSDWLEVEAAQNEHAHGMSRHEAQHKAHVDYKRKHVVDMAAHAYAGMRAAEGEDKQKYTMDWHAACEHLGCDPSGPLPDEVKAQMESEDFKHPVHHVGHPAASLLGHDGSHIYGEVEKSEDPDRLQVLAKAARLALALESFLAKGDLIQGKFPSGKGQDKGKPAEVVPHPNRRTPEQYATHKQLEDKWNSFVGKERHHPANPKRHLNLVPPVDDVEKGEVLPPPTPNGITSLQRIRNNAARPPVPSPIMNPSGPTVEKSEGTDRLQVLAKAANLALIIEEYLAKGIFDSPDSPPVKESDVVNDWHSKLNSHYSIASQAAKEGNHKLAAEANQAAVAHLGFMLNHPQGAPIRAAIARTNPKKLDILRNRFKAMNAPKVARSSALIGQDKTAGRPAAGWAPNAAGVKATVKKEI